MIKVAIWLVKSKKCTSCIPWENVEFNYPSVATNVVMESCLNVTNSTQHTHTQTQVELSKDKDCYLLKEFNDT